MAIAPELKEEQQSPDAEGYGKLLATDPKSLLSYYVEHSISSLEKLRGGLSTFLLNPLNNLYSIKRHTDEVAFDLISLCPGTDQLHNADLEVLFSHCSFASLWLNLAYINANEENVPEQKNDSEDLLIKYINNGQTYITSELARLKLDTVEFAALKAICVWKMGKLDNTTTAKVLSGEHYLGVAKALNEYHQNRPWQDFQMAARLADITAMMAPISSGYLELMRVYQSLNIDDSYRGDFF